jgi:hypothetical protein
MKRLKIKHITLYWLFSFRNPQISIGLNFSFACTTIKILFFEISFWHMHNIHDMYPVSFTIDERILRKYELPITNKILNITEELGYQDNRTWISSTGELIEKEEIEIQTSLYVSRKLSEEEIKIANEDPELVKLIESKKREYEKLKWYEKFFPQLAPVKVYED